MAIKPFIKWSGSKRSQASEIVSYFPSNIEVYYEPFLGSGAVLGHMRPPKAVCGDVNRPLIGLWKMIQDDPKKLSRDYQKNWSRLQEEGHTYFYKIRERFNEEQSPLDLLFLTRTCVNGLIRYNKQGEFNNSLHHTRKGIQPARLKQIIAEWSDTVQGHTFLAQSYELTTKDATPQDFIYLDPPYFNTGTRYFGAIDYDKFISYLNSLNKRGVRYALSYDGKRGNESYIVQLPKNLYKRHIMLHSGNSTFGKVQNKKVEKVYESLYLNY